MGVLLITQIRSAPIPMMYIVTILRFTMIMNTDEVSSGTCKGRAGCLGPLVTDTFPQDPFVKAQCMF